MVLNPGHILDEDNRFCGVSLNLPAFDQISSIHLIFPNVRKLGVLYDPANNQGWVDMAAFLAKREGLDLIKLAVNNRSEINRLFGRDGPRVDAVLFIPDRTVISKAIIGHVIKTAIYHGIPCIGYNRYFYESGAALSFVIDYEKVGEKVAQKVETAAGEPCESSGPPYEILINKTVIKTLNLRVNEEKPKASDKSP
jgi:putative ABC transport system substrate-binding protein